MVPCRDAVIAIAMVRTAKRVEFEVFIDALQLIGHLGPLKRM
jgi:hypothetical protein